MTLALYPLLFVLLMTLVSAVSDIRSLRIPNWHSLLIIAAFIPACYLNPTLLGAIKQHLGAMVILFVVTYLLFIRGFLGGGDAKLATALALWTGLKGLFAFILYTTMAGGVLGMLALLLHKKKIFSKPLKGSWIDKAQRGYSAVPYAVAIGAGFWLQQFQAGNFSEIIKKIQILI